MYTFKQNLVSKDKYSIKCPYAMKVEYITVHDTANRATAENEIKYMISNDKEVSFHLAVDETQVIQGLPFDRNSWSCGDGKHGKGNRNSISIEICRPIHNDKSLYTKAEENAVYVVARLLYTHNLSIEKLKKHQDWSGKTCPNVLLREGRWNTFKERVNIVLKAIHNGKCSGELSSGTTTITTESTNYVVGDKVKVLQSAQKYATGEAIKSFVKGSTYEIIRIEEDKLLLSKITSWVYAHDVEKVSDSSTVATGKGSPSHEVVSSTGRESFLVEIICDELNIRQKADFNSKVVGTVKRGEVYTIIKEENGLGKLKSGIGYISMNLTYIKRK